MSVRAALAAIDAAGCVLERDRDAVARDLAGFHQLLIKWQKVQNLVAARSLGEFWTRHVADSLQLLRHMPHVPFELCDIGSGGGLPGLPLAIALKGSGARLTLVESNSRKVAFLRTVVRQLDLEVTVADARIEAFVSRETARFDVFTARALAPLAELCEFVFPIWAPHSVALFPKGREHVEEIAKSDARWQHNVLIHPSQIDPSGVILEITGLRPSSD